MPSSSSPGARGDSGLGQRLLWITAFRTIATTLLLVTLSTRLLSQPVEPVSAEDTRAFVLIGLVYLVIIGYALLLRLGRNHRALAYCQIVGDVVLATVMVVQTGGLESPFTFVYLLAVLAGSVLLGQRGAVVAGAFSSAALLTRTLLLQLPNPPAWLGPDIEPLERKVFLLVSNLLGQFLIAWLSSYLAEQLRTTGGRLIQREADLSALATLQQQILSSMPSGLITSDGGAVTYLNRAAASILEIPDERTGQRLDELLPGVNSLVPGARRNELLVQTNKGPRILGLSVSKLDDSRDALLVVFQDLTTLRRTEEELKRADHLAALGKLSAQLAHEIRNPLAAMRGAAQLIVDELPPDGPTGKLSRILIRESDRLGGLVNDFLKFARPARPQLRSVALDSLAAQVVEMLRTDPLTHGVKLLTDLEPGSALVDPEQLQQVLINLIRNACAVVGPAGTVKVGVRTQSDGSELWVWDSAGAIAPEDFPKIFEPFFSKRPGGTGLGLSTAHSIVRAHGGAFHVWSSPERGTEFRIHLPADAGKVAA